MRTTRITAVGFGRRVGIDIPADQLEALRPMLPHWWVDAPVEPENIWTIPAAIHALTLLGELEHWVAEHAVGVVFVHAAMVTVAGRALLLPGPSMCGKSTLTTALVRAGAGYGSDEYAVVGPDGLVRPYPRALVMRSEEPHRVPAEQLGGEVVSAAHPVSAIATVTFEAGAEYAVTPMSPAEGVLALLANTVCARSRPGEALAALAAATGRARFVGGVRGEANSAVAPLRELILGDHQKPAPTAGRRR